MKPTTPLVPNPAPSTAVAAEADDVWSGILASFDDGRSAWPRLVLNDANSTVRRVLNVVDPVLFRLSIESLYCRALMLGHHPMQPADRVMLDRSFLALLDRALEGAGE